jgi:putative chitinase
VHFLPRAALKLLAFRKYNSKDNQMNKTTFFAYARRAPFGGRLSQAQVDGTSAILAEAERRNLPDEQIAYILATVFHETGGKMHPIKETQKPSEQFVADKTVVKRLDNAWASGKLKQVRTPYWRFDKKGKAWFGRGFAQVTHETNYKKFGIADAPEKALELSTAIRVLFEGMVLGKFTGRKLADYFGKGKANPEGARVIVNGTDKATLIAGYYRNFLDSLIAAREMKAAAPDDAKPDDVPLLKDKTVQTIVAAGGGTFLTGLISAVSYPWAFLTIALVLVAIGGGFWLWHTGRLELKRVAA